MEKIIEGIILIIAGLALIVFRKKFIRDVLSFQNRTFGFGFGARTARLHERFAIPFGLLVIIFGALIATGVF